MERKQANQLDPQVLQLYDDYAHVPQHLGGDATNHTHAMYRDPTNDYGSAWTAPTK